jgi:hypothetical protein
MPVTKRPPRVCTPMANMPGTKRTKRTSLVEKRARAVCAGLARATESGPMQWRMVRLTARSVAFDYKTADAAISYAIQKGWLIGEGEPPHSVCLTVDGRSLSATSRRRAP